VHHVGEKTGACCGGHQSRNGGRGNQAVCQWVIIVGRMEYSSRKQTVY
jgi:hypothetical protein